MKIWRYILALLVLVAVTVWLAVFNYPQQKLQLIACDVGQGDAILAVIKETQILIDGGPGSSVLSCLEKYMPFWDRDIELVVMTHPQLDHFEGLIEIFRRYNVEKLLANSIDSSSQAYQLLKNVVGGSNTTVLYPESGMIIRVGLMQLEVVHPSEQFARANSEVLGEKQSANVLGATTTKLDPNDFSIVAILRYGDFNALVTGDIGPSAIDDVLATGFVHDVDYLKVPHHGSKNGLTGELLDASKPEIAVISVGKNNRFGHPHQETLDLLNQAKVPVYRTDEVGDVVVKSDGKSWWVVN